MARKKKPQEHVNHERWLVSYADFITLLFAFFVVMYAISELDKRKMVEARKSFQFALSSNTEGGETKNPFAFFDAKADSPFGGLDPVERREVPGDVEDEGGTETQPQQGVPATEKKPSVPPVQRDKQLLNRLKADLEGSIVIEGLTGSKLGIEVDTVPEGLRIRLPREVLFATGSIELRDDAWVVLADLAAMLRASNRTMRIDGHDQVSETSTTDAWMLSLLRATRLARFFITRGGVTPAQISASGYGDHRPIASSVGAPANARYEIIVLRDGEAS